MRIERVESYHHAGVVDSASLVRSEVLHRREQRRTAVAFSALGQLEFGIVYEPLYAAGFCASVVAFPRFLEFRTKYAAP